MALREYFDTEWLYMHSGHAYYLYYLLPVFLIVILLRRSSRQKLKLPPGPIGLPLIGYLPFLGKEPSKVLHNLSKKYGNVFSLYLGQTYVVILADDAAVKDAFSKTTTTDRPPELFGFLPDGTGLSSVNGTEWIEQRRFTVKSMKDIGLGRTTWSSLVEDEVSDFLKELLKKEGRPTDIKPLLTASICSNICSLVFGNRLPPGPERDKLINAIDGVMLFFSQDSFWNYFPWICSILVKLKITNYYDSSCEMSMFNKLIRKQIELHRQSQSGCKGSDFISTYVEAMENKPTGENTFFNETNLVGNTQALFLAGTDTTRISLLWLFLAMASFPDIQEKVHRELDSVLEEKQSAAWEDRAKFPYTYATIMEAQRWKTIAPLNTSRVAMEDIQVCGYDIPKGSTIIANNWGLHNDTRYWSKPEEFNPERFLQNGGGDVILKPDSYVPFSYGKRRCPGDVVAMMEIFLYITGVMKMFEIKAPNGGKPNLDALHGLTYMPVSHKLCFLLRQ